MVNSWNKFETHLVNEGVTKLRIKKLLQMYNSWERFTNKSLDKLSKLDIENVVTDLNKGVIKRRDGKAYGVQTISDLKKFIKQYFKYLKGENNYFPSEVAWINVKIPKDQKTADKDIITVNQVKNLAKTFSNPVYKLAVLVLFDSGFRIDELMSVRKRDLTINVFNENNDKCYFINCNNSKTFQRNIPIPIFSEDIKEFIDTNDEFLLKKDNDLIFDFSYESFTNLLKIKGSKLLNIKVTAHVFRHSSATHYTHKFKLTHHQLCDRYGWSYSSNIPARYIRRSGNNNLTHADKVFSEDIKDLKKENKKLQDEIFGLKDVVNDIVKQLLKKTPSKPFDELPEDIKEKLKNEHPEYYKKNLK